MLQFDGVYFQWHMKKDERTKRHAYLEANIEDYRIYAKYRL